MKTQKSLEADRMNGYLALLFLLLSTATLFDGFDAGLLSFAAPEVRATFDIGLGEWGLVTGLTRFGVMASFLFLVSADRWGRRTLLMVTVLGFTFFNGLTAFADSKAEFIAWQFLARLFLTAEYALAVIVIGEEFPARSRGRGIAILTSLATVGVMIMAKLQPYVLLEPGAESNWIHGLGTSIVLLVQETFGLQSDHENWRALYALGALPLVLVFVLRFCMRETRRFDALQKSSSEEDGADTSLIVPKASSLREQFNNALTPWQARYRKRSAVVTLLWNCAHLVTAPSVVYWVIFAREDLGLTTVQVGDIVFWGYAGGVAGHFAAGYLIDRIGRKYTCAGFYVLAAASIYMLYHVHTLQGQYIWMTCTVFSFAAANTATHVYASELFPTEIRATGYGWTTNFLGRISEVITPIAIGVLIVPLGGIPAAIGVVAIGPVLGAALVLRYAPETRGLTLEEIQIKLDGEADAGA